ncbi:MAG TPA: thioredoxin domain-containing protein [Anaerolineales bacterium]|nr:thioredoxin domain-containing protein [Anaerolineales bacterium]
MNKLATETSPYLLQHAHNPVDWYPWEEEALAKAKAEDKPIFLSIGYSACHWCHVMAHESFENPELAAIMNEHFVNVKVDREERPDLDAIYMDAVVSMTGHGGWPMSVFLTPDGIPFYGGTYFPPVRRGGMPSFTDVLLGVQDAWLNRREAVTGGGKEIVDHIQRSDLATAMGNDELSEETLLGAVKGLWSTFDWRHAGWGAAPKFPQPMTIEFLLRHHHRTGDALALEMVTKTLDAMLKGGMYDQLGGGFHRYSTDAVWLVPHFEKMLYDNSQLARAYLHAWLVTRQPEYKRVVEEILDYVLREMTDASGGFYSTQDADSEGEEGKFFVWDEAEVDLVLGEDAPLFKAMYGVTQGGNFEGKSILSIVGDVETLARKFNLSSRSQETSESALSGSPTSPDVGRSQAHSASLRGDKTSESVSTVEDKLAVARRKLFAVREKRIRPGLDDKVLSGWNGLMLAAFAESARHLGRANYRAAAVANAEFILREMRTPAGRLYRSWRKGEAKLNGYLEDYAYVAEGMLTLYETTFEPRWFTAARELVEAMIAHFADPSGGFFDTSDDHESLVFRPKSVQDNATPSGNALAASVLLKLASLTGEARYADIVEKMLRQVQPVLPRYPAGFAQWLTALAYALGNAREVAIVGSVDADDTQAMLGVAWEKFRPFQVTAVGGPDTPIPLLNDRRQLNGKATAYVCEHFACRAPVTEVEEFRQALEARVR